MKWPRFLVQSLRSEKINYPRILYQIFPPLTLMIILLIMQCCDVQTAVSVHHNIILFVTISDNKPVEITFVTMSMSI